jgi:hypothetical protein
MICFGSITSDPNFVSNPGFTFPANLRIAVFEILSKLRISVFILGVFRVVRRRKI